MCPMCWGTLLASYSLLLSGSAVLLAARDRIVLLLAGGLAGLAALRRGDIVASPGWLIVGLLILLAGRVGWLVVCRRNQWLPAAIWRRAMALAAARCPRRTRLASGACEIFNSPPEL